VRIVFALVASAAFAQTVRFEPAAPRQGDTLRVFASAPAAAAARLADRTARFFPDPGGARLALVPVPVLAAPGRRSVEILDGSGNVLSSHKVLIRDARFRRQNVTLSKDVVALKPAPGEMETVRALRETVTEQRHWDEPFVRPVPGCMTSPFGNLRMHNGKPTGSFHGGLDQRGAEGTPIVAAASGMVKIVRMFNIHGGTVGIDHGQGVTSTYLHMSGFAVKEGASVRKGDVIGYVGTTGRSTAPHLHWGIAVHGHHVNPRQWVDVAPCPSVTNKKGGR
jgi:murein DD-endopeptidase MepM/ murein hydrolase activator NlpD